MTSDAETILLRSRFLQWRGQMDPRVLAVQCPMRLPQILQTIRVHVLFHMSISIHRSSLAELFVRSQAWKIRGAHTLTLVHMPRLQWRIEMISFESKKLEASSTQTKWSMSNSFMRTRHTRQEWRNGTADDDFWNSLDDMTTILVSNHLPNDRSNIAISGGESPKVGLNHIMRSKSGDFVADTSWRYNKSTLSWHGSSLKSRESSKKFKVAAWNPETQLCNRTPNSPAFFWSVSLTSKLSEDSTISSFFFYEIMKNISGEQRRLGRVEVFERVGVLQNEYSLKIKW